jgi:hypothetical protein
MLPTQRQLDRAVARRTGESLATIRRLGFGPLVAGPDAPDLEPEDLQLALDCPFCGHPVALASGPGGPPPLAGCDRCDVEFGYDPSEVYPAPAVAVGPRVDVGVGRGVEAA